MCRNEFSYIACHDIKKKENGEGYERMANIMLSEKFENRRIRGPVFSVL